IVLPFGEDINTFTPVQHPANDENSTIVTTHFDYHSIDSNLLKLDILGHDDPTMIRMLQDLTGKDPRDFPLSTPEVMSLFKDTSALGVTPAEIRGCPLGALGLPEFGTDNAINMLLETKPQYVSDLIRISGLAHGTNVWHGNAQTLISEGKCTIATAVCTRDDIMVYLIDKGLENERAFKIMEDVRKGRVAKKKSDYWNEWKEDMISHGVPDWYIWSCEHIEYMFPKAHAAAYVMMALRIAYCKVFYPLAYYCAYFSIRASGFNYELMCLGKEQLERNMDALEKKANLSAKEEDVYRDMRIVQEMYARGFSFVPIDIYKAQSTRFLIVDDRHLMPSLISIDGMGSVAADTVVEAAESGRPFTSLDNFRQRTKVSQTLIDKMQKLHILDGLPQNDQFSLFDL
ncbi:MAG: PolC-type DNA polymerase III, partial [Lachnospiraceae bacterium]|nr:PolC-type DNA polymerase III [Lachnospiraceae bacterium]